MKTTTCCCMLLACVLGRAAQAQSRSSQAIEFGADAMFGRTWDHTPVGDFSLSELDVPVQAIRVAFPLGEHLALEPSLSLLKESGYFSGTRLTLDGALLYELSTDRSRPQWFLRPFIGINHESATGVTAGGGVGIRIPATDRIAARFEARYRYTSLGNSVSSDALGLLAGVSVYTR